MKALVYDYYDHYTESGTDYDCKPCLENQAKEHRAEIPLTGVCRVFGSLFALGYDKHSEAGSYFDCKSSISRNKIRTMELTGVTISADGSSISSAVSASVIHLTTFWKIFNDIVIHHTRRNRNYQQLAHDLKEIRHSLRNHSKRAQATTIIMYITSESFKSSLSFPYLGNNEIFQIAVEFLDQLNKVIGVGLPDFEIFSITYISKTYGDSRQNQASAVLPWIEFAGTYEQTSRLLVLHQAVFKSRLSRPFHPSASKHLKLFGPSSTTSRLASRLETSHLISRTCPTTERRKNVTKGNAEQGICAIMRCQTTI
jgi:hypothetical protein